MCEHRRINLFRYKKIVFLSENIIIFRFHPIDSVIIFLYPESDWPLDCRAKGVILMKDEKSGEYTHHEGKISSITAHAEITEQEGWVQYCEFSSDKGMNEIRIWVIELDNKTVHFAAMDGFPICEIMSDDFIHVICGHITDDNSVVVAGIWIRVL
jgi:hypothetical protein